MIIEPVTYTDALWDEVKRYTAACSWRAGKSLAQEMQNHAFSDWERVFVLHENGNIYGYCTVAKKDCIPDLTYTPYIGYLFVDEKKRGHRMRQKLILAAMDYLRNVGFHEVYLVSDHENLYEKYGFSVICRAAAPWGAVEKIYHQSL